MSIFERNGAEWAVELANADCRQELEYRYVDLSKEGEPEYCKVENGRDSFTLYSNPVLEGRIRRGNKEEIDRRTACEKFTISLICDKPGKCHIEAEGNGIGEIHGSRIWLKWKDDDTKYYIAEKLNFPIELSFPKGTDVKNITLGWDEYVATICHRQ